MYRSPVEASAPKVLISAILASTPPWPGHFAAGVCCWADWPVLCRRRRVSPWGVLGALVSHQWDGAGEDDFDTSITGGQYFYAFNLKDGWQINASPTFSYNHEASSGNEWTFPVGIGASKTSIIGGRPWKFGIQYWHYVESPDNFGPAYQIRFSVSPVVDLPW